MTHTFTITVHVDMTDVADDRTQCILDRIWTQVRNAINDIRTTVDMPSTLTMERWPLVKESYDTISETPETDA